MSAFSTRTCSRFRQDLIIAQASVDCNWQLKTANLRLEPLMPAVMIPAVIGTRTTVVGTATPHLSDELACFNTFHGIRS